MTFVEGCEKAVFDAPAICGIAKVPIERGWHCFVPFVVLIFIVQMFSIAVSVMIGWQ